MKLKIVVIDLETPAWMRRAAAIVGPVTAVLVSGAVFATPKQWVTGDPLTAASLNSLNVISANGLQYSVGATHFCGIGPVSTTGNFQYGGKTGFAAAKAMCEASTTCGTKTAHMCSAEEIVRSRALGDPLVSGWYSTQVLSTWTVSAGTTEIANDCAEWTTNSAGYGAALAGLASPGTDPLINSCSASNSVLCCD